MWLAVVVIRTARSDDAGPIADVHIATWRAAYAGMIPNSVLLGLSSASECKYWRRAIAARPGECAVYVAATADGEILGYGSAGRARPNGLPYTGEIYTLYVAPDHQGKGLGRGLLHAMFDQLRGQGCGTAMLWVLAANPARFFYSAMGGTLAAQRNERHFGVALDELVYGWADLKYLAGVQETAQQGRANRDA